MHLETPLPFNSSVMSNSECFRSVLYIYMSLHNFKRLKASRIGCAAALEKVLAPAELCSEASCVLERQVVPVGSPSWMWTSQRRECSPGGSSQGEQYSTSCVYNWSLNTLCNMDLEKKGGGNWGRSYEMKQKGVFKYFLMLRISFLGVDVLFCFAKAVSGH